MRTAAPAFAKTPRRRHGTLPRHRPRNSPGKKRSALGGGDVADVAGIGSAAHARDLANGNAPRGLSGLGTSSHPSAPEARNSAMYSGA
jgi:hypothetical protein